jgi:hypothetical protein
MAAGTGGPLQPADNAILKQVYGYEIYVCPGFSNDCLLFAQPENLFVGTDLVSDMNEVKVVDMSLTDASDNVRMANTNTSNIKRGGVFGSAFFIDTNK